MKKPVGQSCAGSLTMILEGFEEAWKRAAASPLEAFLAANDDELGTDILERRGILVELVALDLEHCWKRFAHNRSSNTATNDFRSPSPPRCLSLEQYLTVIPELGTLDDLPLQLFEQEYRVRRKWGGWQRPADFEVAYPRFFQAVHALLDRVDRDLAREVPVPNPTVDVAFAKSRTDKPPYLLASSSLDSENAAASPHVGDYEILGEIARGGMGVVFRARQTRLNRIVALKMILSGQLASEDDVRRFYSEAEAAAHLDHVGVVPIYEVGEHEGRHFFSMALIEGKSLHELLRQGPLPPRSAAELLIAVAEAVSYAHVRGIVHRDLKPQNILIDADGAPKLTDFGLAKRLDQPEELTVTGAVLGTPSYMAPEQAAGRTREVGSLSDVYSIGAILYATLTGHPPFRAASIADTLRQVVEQDVVRPSLANPTIPRDLETICLKCLRKSPADRYASASDLAMDLARFLRGEAILARPTSRIEKLSRWARRNPASAALVLVSVAALAMTIGLSQYFTYQLAVADGQAKLHEQERRVEGELRQAAEQRRQAAEEIASTQQYYAKLMSARDQIGRQANGWPGEALKAVAEAASLRTTARNANHLRTAAAVCLSGIELRPVGKIAEDFDSGVLAFHPSRPELALAEGRPRGLNQFSLRVRIVEFPSGKLVRELRYPANVAQFARTKKPDRPVRMAWSRDGRWIVVVSRFGTAHLFDLNSPEQSPQSLELEANTFLTAVFSRDSQFLFTAGRDFEKPGVVRRWRLGEKTQETTRREFGEVLELGIPASPSELTVLEETRLTTVSAETLAEKNSTGIQSPGPMALDPSGRILLVARDGRLEWCEPTTYGNHGPLRSQRDADVASRGVRMIAWSPDSSAFLHLSRDSSVLEFWDAVTGENFAEWPVAGGAGYAAFDSSGRWVAVCSDFHVQVLECIRFPEHAAAAVQFYTPVAVGLSPQDDQLATVADADQSEGTALVSTWRLDNPGAPLAQPRRIGYERHHELRSSLAFHPDGSQIVVAASFSKTLESLSSSDLTPRWRRESPGARSVAFTPSGRQLWVAQEEELLAFANPVEPKWLAWKNNWAVLNSGGLMTSVTAGEDWVLCGNGEGVLHCFSTRLPAVAADFKPVWSKSLPNPKAIRALGLTSDQTHAYAGDDTGRLYRLRLRDQVVHSHAAHQQAINSLAVLPSGVLVSGSSDRTIRFWRWGNDEPEALFELPASGSVLQFSSTPDGNRLAVIIANERGVHLWNLAALSRRFSTLGIAY